jgi:hypothetical protein
MPGQMKKFASKGSVTDTELPALALIAGRVASAIKRSQAQEPLDSQDRRDLRAAREALLKNTDASSTGRRLPDRHIRSRRLIVSTAREASDQTVGLSAKLSAFADDLERIRLGAQPEDAEKLLRYYEELAVRARRQSQGRTETVVRR